MVTVHYFKSRHVKLALKLGNGLDNAEIKQIGKKCRGWVANCRPLCVDYEHSVH
ncbi:4613_t:CDS:1, partial [Ambispora leptoticha]